jgi:hypothetical protein
VIGCWASGPLAEAVQELDTVIAGVEGRSEPVYVIARGHVEQAAGRPVTEDDLARVAKAIPGSALPRELAAIVQLADGVLLLCDGCYQAGTGLLAECEDGCMQDLDHTGLCLRSSNDECEWCGAPGRLHQVTRAGTQDRLPTVGKEDEGQWFLHWPGTRQGPYPSAQAAWDAWHASGEAARVSKAAEPWCNHDPAAVHDGVCECGTAVPSTVGPLTAERFTLDEAAAANWLKRATRQTDGGAALDGQEHEPGLPAVSAGWRPGDDQHSGPINELLHAAAAAGILRCPPGWTLAYDYTSDVDGAGGRWLLINTDDARPLILADAFTDTRPTGEGAEAALELLLEGQLAGNELLADLHRYTSHMHPSTPEDHGGPPHRHDADGQPSC